jgi:hypothetical protein
MIIRSNYRSETLYYASLRSEGGPPDVPARSAGGLRSIDLRPKYLSPISCERIRPVLYLTSSRRIAP